MEQIPNDECKWVTICSKKKENYHVITSKKESRSRYYLYDCRDGKIERLGSAESPTELEEQWPL